MPHTGRWIPAAVIWRRRRKNQCWQLQAAQLVPVCCVCSKEPQNEQLSSGEALIPSLIPCGRAEWHCWCHPVESHIHSPLSGALWRSPDKLLPPSAPINPRYHLLQPICPMFLLSPRAPKAIITLLQVKQPMADGHIQFTFAASASF